MRIRTGHGPADWTDNVPESAHMRARSAYANVPAETVGNMRPVLTFGGNHQEPHTGYRQKALKVKP